MSAAALAITTENRIRATLKTATEASGKTDSWFADRIGCSREQFNKAKNGKASMSFPQVVSWSVLVGVPLVAGVMQNSQGEG